MPLAAVFAIGCAAEVLIVFGLMSRLARKEPIEGALALLIINTFACMAEFFQLVR